MNVNNNKKVCMQLIAGLILKHFSCARAEKKLVPRVFCRLNEAKENEIWLIFYYLFKNTNNEEKC